MRIIADPTLWLIKIYQKTLSLDHGYLGKKFPNVRVCRMHPSCSEYSYTAIDRFGSIKGLILSAIRIIKCGPWTPAGTYDPVPEK